MKRVCANVKFFSKKKNAPFATIVDLSYFIYSSNYSKNVIYTTSFIVNRNYLKNVFNNTDDLLSNVNKGFSPMERVMVIRVVRNRHKETERFNLGSTKRFYYIMQYKYFFNETNFNNLGLARNKGVKIFLIIEGVGLTLLKVIKKN